MKKENKNERCIYSKIWCFNYCIYDLNEFIFTFQSRERYEIEKYTVKDLDNVIKLYSKLNDLLFDF